ncbi:hypothetical protein PN36_30365 [Candidatus Thiomargarita nelsonii]|uniref:Uncharacterized protein n=1 Tax=Candidatus Thiomargarita nelsonii TaxID=1003181 RepID=A0A4E0RLT8_9GAMM|nr:hypothetical protein PN36_30365 [Candidatus Thiomargarita nelsonii]
MLNDINTLKCNKGIEPSNQEFLQNLLSLPNANSEITELRKIYQEKIIKIQQRKEAFHRFVKSRKIETTSGLSATEIIRKYRESGYEE